MASVAASPSTSGRCAPRTTRPPATRHVLALRRAPSPAAPLRATIVGDSVAETLAPSIAVGFDELARRTGIPHDEVQSAALNGFGFASALPGIRNGKREPGFPAFRDWQGLFDRAVTRHDPDVVVALVGSWDLLPREVGDAYLDPASCGWAAWYRPLVEQAVQRRTANGAVVVWLAFPYTARDTDPLHFALNAVFRDVAAAHPASVAYVDLDGFVCPDGRVVPEMRAPDGTSHRVRDDDDTHFAFYGAPPVLGPYFADAFQRLLPLGP